MTVDQNREIRELAARVAAEVYAPMADELDVHRRPLPAEERRRLGRVL